MLRSLCIPIALAAVLLAVGSAGAQNASNNAEQPTFGERIEQFGRNLFGGSEGPVPTPSRSANRKFVGTERPLLSDEQANTQPIARRSTPQPSHPELTTSRRRTAAENATTTTPVVNDAPPAPPRQEPPSTARPVQRPSQAASPTSVEPRTTAPPRTGSLPLRREATEPARVRLDDRPRVNKTPSQPREDSNAPEEFAPSRAGRSLAERLAAAREIRPTGETSPATSANRPLATSQHNSQPETTPNPRQASQPTPATPRVAALEQPTRPEPVTVSEETPPAEPQPAQQPVVAAPPANEPKPQAEQPTLAPPVAARETKNRQAINAADSDVLIARQSPIIGVETAGPRSIKIGAPANFRVVMRNAGQVAGEGVLAEVQIPEWTEVVSSRASHGSARVVRGNNRQMLVEWTVGDLAAGGHETLDLQIVPRKSEPFDLGVQWKHSPIVSQTQVVVQEPKLELKVKGPDETLYGREETYELIIANPGTGDAENVVVRLVAAGPTEENAATHPVGLVRAGETKVVEIELTAREAGEFWIKAEGAADGGLSASTAEMVVVRRAELDVEISGPSFQYAGTMAEYRILVTNRGNAPAREIEVNTLLPPAVRHLASSERGRVDVQTSHLVWSVVGLPPGEQREFSLKCELTAPGEIRPEVVCRAADDLTATATANTVVEALADLVLEVSDPQGPMPIGAEAVYEIRIHNRGTTGAQQIDLAAFFSEGIEPVSASPVDHQVASGQVVFNTIAELGAGETIVLEVRAVAEMSGNHAFRAELTCEPLGTKLAAQEMTRFYDSGQSAR